MEKNTKASNLTRYDSMWSFNVIFKVWWHNYKTSDSLGPLEGFFQEINGLKDALY